MKTKLKAFRACLRHANWSPGHPGMKCRVVKKSSAKEAAKAFDHLGPAKVVIQPWRGGHKLTFRITDAGRVTRSRA